MCQILGWIIRSDPCSQRIINGDVAKVGENPDLDSAASRYGPWMLNRRQPKRKENRLFSEKSGERPRERDSPKATPRLAKKGSGSRFDILAKQPKATNTAQVVTVIDVEEKLMEGPEEMAIDHGSVEVLSSQGPKARGRNKARRGRGESPIGPKIYRYQKGY